MFLPLIKRNFGIFQTSAISTVSLELAFRCTLTQTATASFAVFFDGTEFLSTKQSLNIIKFSENTFLIYIFYYLIGRLEVNPSITYYQNPQYQDKTDSSK